MWLYLISEFVRSNLNLALIEVWKGGGTVRDIQAGVFVCLAYLRALRVYP